MKYKMSKDAQQNAEIMSGEDDLADVRWQYELADKFVQLAINKAAKRGVYAAVAVNRVLTKGLMGVADVLETVMEGATEEDVREEFFKIVRSIYDLRQEQRAAHKKGLN